MNYLRNLFLTIRTNIKSIITAVITSAIIWLAISFQLFPDVTRSISDIPIAINLTSDMQQGSLELAEDYELTTSVQVTGKRREVDSLTAEDFKAELDLSEINEEGEQVVTVIITSDSSADFVITQQNRTERIRIARIESKTLEITAKADAIRFMEGMQIDEAGLTSNPPTVTISGEKSLIDSISRAEVHAEYEDEMTGTSSVKGELALFDVNDVRVHNPDIHLDADYFTVTVPIHKVKTLPLDFIIHGAPYNFNLNGLLSKMELNPKALTLSAPDSSIDNLAYFDVGEMSLNELTPEILKSITRDTIAPKLPEGYKNISGEASFSYRFNDVEDYGQFDFTIESRNITILSPPEGVDVEILTKELTITVVGPASQVQALSTNRFNVTLNLAGQEITTDTMTIRKDVQCRINGTNINMWVIGYPQVDITFTRS